MFSRRATPVLSHHVALIHPRAWLVRCASSLLHLLTAQPASVTFPCELPTSHPNFTGGAPSSPSCHRLARLLHQGRAGELRESLTASAKLPPHCRLPWPLGAAAFAQPADFVPQPPEVARRSHACALRRTTLPSQAAAPAQLLAA